MRRKIIKSYIVMICIAQICIALISKVIVSNNSTVGTIGVILTNIAIGIIVAIIVGSFFSKRMASPIYELIKKSKAISDGDFNQYNILNTRDELEQLSHTFNLMSRQISLTVKELQGQNSKIQSILNSMESGILAIDENEYIIMMNPSCEKLLNLEIGTHENHHVYDVIHQPRIVKIIKQAFEYEVYEYDELEYEERIIRINATPITFPQSVIQRMGILLVIRDVTQIRKLEHMRSEFVSSVSHELKTPLTSIRGFAETLKNGAIHNPEVAEKFINIIDVEAERLYYLIQNTLDLSELESMSMSTEDGLCDIEEVIVKSKQLLEDKAKEKSIDIFVHIERPLPFYYCDPDRVQQIVVNLLSNALQYTDEGYVKVTAACVNWQLVLSVEDTGIGIPEESIPRLFERFYRVDKGRSRKNGGTGLGLSIVKYIVKLYNGTIHVESTIGKGSKFIVKLPYKWGGLEKGS